MVSLFLANCHFSNLPLSTQLCDDNAPASVHLLNEEALEALCAAVQDRVETTSAYNEIQPEKRKTSKQTGAGE